MLGNKPGSKQPWSIQVLTPDYLIDGGFDDSKDNGSAMYLFKAWPDMDSKLDASISMHLTSVRFQPVGSLTAPSGSVPDWFVFSNAFVALIPRDEVSTAYVAANNASMYLIPADIFVGSYIIRGTILCPDKNLSRLKYYFNFAVQNAQIESVTPGAKLQAFTAPFAIVRTHLIQGIAYSAQ
jgi:hypothetical protein